MGILEALLEPGKDMEASLAKVLEGGRTIYERLSAGNTLYAELASFPYLDVAARGDLIRRCKIFLRENAARLHEACTDADVPWICPACFRLGIAAHLLESVLGIAEEQRLVEGIAGVLECLAIIASYERDPQPFLGTPPGEYLQ